MLYRLAVSPYLNWLDFSRATKDSGPQWWARKLTFSATVHQTTLTTMVQSNVVPTFRWGAAKTPKNGSTRYNTQDITSVSSKMLCSSKAAHSILATIRTYSNEFTNRSSDKGVFTSFQRVKLGFVPLSKFSSRWGLKPEIRYARLKWIEITSRAPSEFKFTQAVVTNPRAQKMSLDWC